MYLLVGSLLASDRVSAAAHDVVFSLHQMLSPDRCPLSIMRRDSGLPFSSLTVPHSKCIDRHRSYWHVQIDRPGLGDVSCNPRTTQEALCAHMLLALVRHTVPKSCSGNVQIVFLLDARKALGLILGLKYAFLVLLDPITGRLQKETKVKAHMPHVSDWGHSFSLFSVTTVLSTF